MFLRFKYEKELVSFSRCVRENVNGSDIFCVLRIDSGKKMLLLAETDRALCQGGFLDFLAF